MSRVALATEGFGVVLDPATGLPRNNQTLVLKRLDGSTPPVYAARTGATVLTPPVKTDVDGVWPGYVDNDTYLLTEPIDGTDRHVEAVSGAQVLSVEASMAVRKEAPYNLLEAETGIKGDGTTDDTAAINAKLAAMQPGFEYLFARPSAGGHYRVSDTLQMPAQRGLTLRAQNWHEPLIIMHADNKPILQINGQYQRGHRLEELNLSYATQQTFASHPNSAALALNPAVAAVDNSNYECLYKRLWFSKATRGMHLLKQGTGWPMYFWNNTIEDIHSDAISHSVLDLFADAPAPVNLIRRVTQIGASPTPQTGTAIRLRCDTVLEAIDIEDWSGRILHAEVSVISLRGLHFERWAFPNDTRGIYLYACVATLEDLWASPIVAAGTSYVFQVYAGEVRIGKSNLGITGAGSLYWLHIASGQYAHIETEAPYATSGALAGVFGSAEARVGSMVRGGGREGGMTSIASATTLTLPNEHIEVYKITGSTAVTSITASWSGRRVTLITQAAITILGKALAAFTKIEVVCDGTYWYVDG